MTERPNETSDPSGAGPREARGQAQFDACVAACFGELPVESVRRLHEDPETGRLLRQLGEVVAILAAPALPPPPRDLRQRVIDLLPSRDALLRRWMQAVERVVSELIAPEPTVALAGLRTASAPLHTYRASLPADPAITESLDAWIDVQVEPVPGTVRGRRIRGQVSVAHGESAPLQVHAVRSDDPDRIDSAPIDADGGFLLELDADEVELLVELTDARRALSIPSIRLRA